MHAPRVCVAKRPDTLSNRVCDGTGHRERNKKAYRGQKQALQACGGGGTSAPAATQVPGAAAPAAATKAPAGAAPAAAAPTTPPAAGKASGEIGWLVRSNPAETKAQEDIFLPAIKKQYPDLKVTQIIVPGKDYIPKLNTMTAGGKPPDIWGFGGNYFDYWARGMAQELDEYINADKFDVDNYFLPGLADKYKVGGKHWGLNQLTTFGTFTIYNKKIFDEAGVPYPPSDWSDTSWNHDKLIDTARKLTKNFGKPDAQYGLHAYGDWAPHQPAWLWGTDPYMPDHYTQYIAQKTNFHDPVLEQMLQFMQDLTYKDKISPSKADLSGLASAATAHPFMTGKIAMTQVSGWGLWTFSPITDFKFGVAPLVPGPGKQIKKIATYNDFWIMAKGSTQKENTWKMMRVLTAVDVVKAYSAASNTPPVVRDALDSWYKIVSDRHGQSVEDLRKVTLGSIDQKVSQESVDHLFIQFPKINDAWNNESDAIFLKSDPVKNVLPGIADKIDAITKSIYDQFNGKLPAH